jgi:prophage antirepressor-like protein
MNDLQIFNYNGNEVRTIQKDGEPWWVLKDVCTVFGETNYRRVSGRLDDDEKGVSQIDTPGGMQSMTVVNEAGLYTTLFAMQPEKARGVTEEYVQQRQEQLKSFRKWVTSEVLPSIRKNGGYIANQENLTPEQIVANALIVAQNIISQKDKQIEQMKPKAEFFDAVADSRTAISMNEVSKVLGIKGYGRNNLFEFLRNNGILDRWNVPYQRYIDCGWFRVIEQKYTRQGEPCVTTKTLVYQKGVDAIRKKILSVDKTV